MSKNLAKVKTTAKENNLEKHNLGSNKKINLGILRLLETLTLVSSQQNKQMKKLKASMKEKPQKIHQLRNQMEQEKKETKNQLNALSIKVDNCKDISDSKKENMRPLEERNIQLNGYVYQDVTSVLSNISDKVCITFQAGTSIKPQIEVANVSFIIINLVITGFSKFLFCV